MFWNVRDSMEVRKPVLVAGERHYHTEEHTMKQSTQTVWIIVSLLLLMIIRPLFMSTMIGLGIMEPGMVWNYANPTSSLTGWTWGLMLMLGSVHMLASWVVLMIGIVVLIRTPRKPSSISVPAGR